MAANKQLEGIITPALTALGLQLWGCELIPGKSQILRVYIDNPDGVTIDDCANASRQVGAVLDVEDPLQGHYELEVSSPGVERPLFTLDQYARFVGKPMRVHCQAAIDGRKNFTGTLRKIIEEDLVLEVDGEEFNLPFDDISKGHLILER